MSGLMNFQRFEILRETKLIVSLGNEQKTDWRTKPLILGIKAIRTTTTCHFFFMFSQEDDLDVKESGDFSKFRLSEETVERLRG